MAVKNYFTETPTDDWDLTTAFNALERDHPSSTTRLLLHELRENLREALSSSNEDVVAKATKLLQEWKIVKKKIIPREDNLTNVNKINSPNGTHSTIITQPSNTTIVVNSNLGSSTSSTSASTSHSAEQIGESSRSAVNSKRQPNRTGKASSSSSSSKRMANQTVKASSPSSSIKRQADQMDEASSSSTNANCQAYEMDKASSSGRLSWNSREKPQKKRKYLNVYLTSYYTNGNFTQKYEWDGLTNDLINYRQTSIDGAQCRKFLSNSRILSLSHIYLFTTIGTCLISKVTPQQQKVIMDNILPNSTMDMININALNFCNEARITLANRTLTKDELEDALEQLKHKYISQEVKTMCKLICDLKYFKRRTDDVNEQGEAALTINVIRPYLIHCIANQIELIKDDWMTYNLPNPHESQAYIPDFVLYLDNISSQNLEFLFVE